MQIFLLLILLIPAYSFELISHKGLHNEECLEAGKLCRADCLTWTGAETLENTIPAIRRAFAMGADRVEIDLRVTKEGEIVLYHDNELSCRTEGKGQVRHHTVKELKKLDVAHNLKFLNREDNPLKGQGIGLIPTLKEVLEAFPHKKFFLNPKDTTLVFRNRLNEVIEEVCVKKKKCSPSDFSMWGAWVSWDSLKNKFPDFGPRFANAYAGNSCELMYKMWAWAGIFPEQCKDLVMVYSWERINTWNTWGWPTQLVRRFHKHGSKVYVIHVKDKMDYELLNVLGFDGVITSRMEMLND